MICVPSRRLWWLAVLPGLLLLASAWPIWRAVHRDRPDQPPEVPLEGVAAEIANLIRSAREDVLRNPQSANSWGHLGKVLLVNGFPSHSVICFERAAALAPEQPRWPYYLAMYFWKPDPGRARDCLERAADLCDQEQPDNPEPRFRLVELLLEQGQLDEADHQVKHLAGQAANHPRLRYYQGLLCCRRGQWRQANDLLEPLAELPQVRKQVLTQLILVASRLGRDALAEQYEQQQARLPADTGWPDRFETEAAELNVVQRSSLPPGNASNAEETLRKQMARARGEGKNDFRVHLHLANLLLQLRRLDEAERAALDADTLAPDNARILGMRGWIAYQRGLELKKAGHVQAAGPLLEKAIELTGKAIVVSDQEAKLHFQLGQVLRAIGKPAEALPALRKAAQLNPDVAEIEVGLGEVLADLDRPKKALRHFKMAVRCARPGDSLPAAKLAEYSAKWKIKEP